jgi:beta-carotene hydroxylase
MLTKQLNYKADYQTLGLVAAYLIFAYSGFFFYEQLSWPGFALLFSLACSFSFFCACLIHNTIHTPVFKKKSWNVVFQYILTFVHGYPVSAFVPGHNFSHHKENQTTKDWTRASRGRFKWNLLNQTLYFFIAVKSLTEGEWAFAKRMKVDNPKWYKQYRKEVFFNNAVKIIFLLINWKAFVLFVFLPQIYGSWGLVGTSVYQHDGCDPNHKFNHSRNFSSPILNFFMCNNGYHGAHHMRPNLHWSKYPAFHDKEIAPHIHPNLNRVSLFAYLWEANIWPGKRLDYLGNPVVLPPKEEDQNESWIISADVHKDKEDLGAVY